MTAVLHTAEIDPDAGQPEECWNEAAHLDEWGWPDCPPSEVAILLDTARGQRQTAVCLECSLIASPELLEQLSWSSDVAEQEREADDDWARACASVEAGLTCPRPAYRVGPWSLNLPAHPTDSTPDWFTATAPSGVTDDELETVINHANGLTATFGGVWRADRSVVGTNDAPRLRLDWLRKRPASPASSTAPVH